ncbi:MAG: hypothetical protein WDO19_01585 [Bacteroidota bacterium]
MKRLFILLAGIYILNVYGYAQEDTTTIKPGDIEAVRRVRRAELRDSNPADLASYDS